MLSTHSESVSDGVGLLVEESSVGVDVATSDSPSVGLGDGNSVSSGVGDSVEMGSVGDSVGICSVGDSVEI
jgi:hypothetical protein